VLSWSVEHKGAKDEDEEVTSALLSVSSISPKSDIRVATLTSSVNDPSISTSLVSTELNYAVARLQKSVERLEKEYLMSIAVLTVRDQQDWLDAVTLLNMNRLDDYLHQAEQQTIAIIDEYYASLREEQAR
jgi:hypothetical protein